MDSYSIVLALLDVMAYTKERAACVATSGPILGSRRPVQSSGNGSWGDRGSRYRIPIAKTIAINGSIERGDTSGI
jgi:hypothetical protein